MTRTRGKTTPRNRQTEPPPWEPEPLHLPVYPPCPPGPSMQQDPRTRKPAAGDDTPEQGSRVIVIDLA